MLDRKIIDQLHKLNHTMVGCCFSLAMRNEDDNITVYDRQSQPCYGELRTYGASHGKEGCTRPDDRRPGDLRFPFPDGTPEAVGVKFRTTFSNNIENHNKFCEYLFGDESPWVKGLGSSKDIEFTKDQNGKYIGFVLLNTDIDPTVLVSLLKFHRGMYAPKADNWCHLQNKLSKFEAFLIGCCSNYNVQSGTVSGFCVSGNYNTISIKRLKEQNPHNLTGGTLRNRYAYNRPEIERLFESEDKKALSPTFTAKPMEKFLEEMRKLY